MHWKNKRSKNFGTQYPLVVGYVSRKTVLLLKKSMEAQRICCLARGKLLALQPSCTSSRAHSSSEHSARDTATTSPVSVLHLNHRGGDLEQPSIRKASSYRPP